MNLCICLCDREIIRITEEYGTSGHQTRQETIKLKHAHTHAHAHTHKNTLIHTHTQTKKLFIIVYHLILFSGSCWAKGGYW